MSSDHHWTWAGGKGSLHEEGRHVELDLFLFVKTAASFVVDSELVEDR